MADYARAELLRQLREGTHLSQEAVAAELGVSTKSLRAWEHGGTIRWDNAKRVGAFYNVDPESLVSREDPTADESPDLAAAFRTAPSQLDRIEALLNRLADIVLEEAVGDVEERAPLAEGPKPVRVPRPRRPR